MRLLDDAALRDEKGLKYSKMQRWRLIRAGKFPPPVKVSAKNFWVESEIDTFIQKLIAERDGLQAA